MKAFEKRRGSINLVTVVHICLRSQFIYLSWPVAALVPKQVEGIVWGQMLFDLSLAAWLGNDSQYAPKICTTLNVLSKIFQLKCIRYPGITDYVWCDYVTSVNSYYRSFSCRFLFGCKGREGECLTTVYIILIAVGWEQPRPTPMG